ncbi:Uncharacterized protein B5E38_5008 [Bacillus cereus]|nr:Uncharacterized protein B5E38_5008 [Bacillus cereus]ARO65094.1 Uncharacterized protein B5E39_2723 [Bacillus cereus]
MDKITVAEFKSLTDKQKREVRKDWRVCPLERWNATTARSYMNELAEIKFKQPYTCNSIQGENNMISRFKKEYGNEALKLFIHRCFTVYTPTKQYPTLSFWFMCMHMKQRVLPQILAELNERREREEALQRQQLQTHEDIQEKVNLF